jgi:hypothetical protein
MRKQFPWFNIPSLKHPFHKLPFHKLPPVELPPVVLPWLAATAMLVLGACSSGDTAASSEGTPLTSVALSTPAAPQAGQDRGTSGGVDASHPTGNPGGRALDPWRR